MAQAMSAMHSSFDCGMQHVRTGMLCLGEKVDLVLRLGVATASFQSEPHGGSDVVVDCRPGYDGEYFA